VGGAELFTGHCLIVMAWASRKVSTARLLRNWGIVYTGNFAGAGATAALVYLSGQYRFGDGAVGRAALATAQAKVGLGFVEAVALGVLCNALVCLAVWLSLSGRTTADKVLVIVPPVPRSWRPGSSTAWPTCTSSRWRCSSRTGRPSRFGRLSAKRQPTTPT
jgi:formate/nitrite transporter FocA (FNT family)